MTDDELTQVLDAIDEVGLKHVKQPTAAPDELGV